MSRLARIGLALLLAVAALAGVLLVRAQSRRAGPTNQRPQLAALSGVDVARAAEHLSQALQIQTVSRTQGAVDSPEALAQFRAFLERTYPALHQGLERELVNEHALLYTWRGSDPALAPLLLLAHQDVVPVEAGTEPLWDAPPFSGAIRDGYVYGRGAIDDKGSLIAICEAVEALRGAGFAPRRSVLLAFGHDEEVHGLGGAGAIARLLAERGVKAWFALDEGMSILLDHPLTGGAVALIGIAEKGYLTTRVTARGQGGHSSAPPRTTAAERLARALLALRAHPFTAGFDGGPAAAMLDQLAPTLPFGERLLVANRWAFDWLLVRKLSEVPYGDALLRTTIAPTMVDGGAKENVLPQEMHAIVNLRLHPRDSVAGALAHLRAAIADIDQVKLEPVGHPNEPSPVSSTESDSYALLSALAQQHAPKDAPVAPMLVLAATDARHYARVAENVYRFQPNWTTQQDRVRVHGNNERQSLDNVGRLVRFYTQLIATAAR